MCFVVGSFRIVLSLNVKRVYFIDGICAASCLLKKIALYPKFCFKEIVIHEDEMDWAYRMHERVHKCLQNFI